MPSRSAASSVAGHLLTSGQGERQLVVVKIWWGESGCDPAVADAGDGLDVQVAVGDHRRLVASSRLNDELMAEYA